MLHSVVLVMFARFVAANIGSELYKKYQIMPKSSFIEYFNAQDYSWKMAEYDNIEKKYTACAFIDKKSMKNLPLVTHDIEAIDLPERFDAREQWPQCETIKEIYDQGDCGSCWSFGTATPASDRTCIHKDVHVHLSEQDLQCLKTDVCEGGYPFKAFEFWRDEGLVTDNCKPYNIEELKKNVSCISECVNSDISYKQDKHFAENIYKISNESDQVMAELVKNGPIQATFNVMLDFMMYTSGIYKCEIPYIVGYHSVRIIGYGVEDGVDYWIVANSWGSDWGENGIFRIKRFQAFVNFENYLIAGMPKN